MDRTQLACYGLLASAFVLGALLLVQLQHRSLTQEANAAMAMTSGSVTAMTARTRTNEESLFILESSAQRLLIYRTDISRNQLRLMQNINLANIFGDISRGSGSSRRTSR